MKKKMLTDTQKQMLAVIQELRELQLTPEEERVLDEFDEFRRQHPINFSSLALGSEDAP